MIEQLLAKSRREGRYLPLEKHLLDTEEAALHIFCLQERWGQNWCRFFKIYEESHRERFLLNLRVSALFHDLGKANEEFQKAVSPRSTFYKQSIRHEHLSALILCLPAVRQWLSNNLDLDLDVITAAVLSHHIKASDADDWEWCQPKGKLQFSLYLDDSQVKAILTRIATVAQLSDPPVLPTEPWTFSSIWLESLEKGQDAARKCKRQLRHNPAKKSLLLAVKAGVIVADAAASALFRETRQLKEWIRQVIDKPITPEEVEAEILKPFAEDYSKKHNGKKFKLHEFQEDLAKEVGSRGLLLTACGSGKTRGAWEWLKIQCGELNIGKLIFLYPTRATALQGFVSYTAWASSDRATHLTGTAQYELESLLENPSENESIKGKDYRLSESDERLFALGYWSRRFFSGTVDQFLSFLEHNYKALCLLPVLADAAIVLDEIHSYDQKMFESLVAFLREFHIPVLCMTATLPEKRKQTLTDLGLVEFPAPDKRHKYKKLDQQETHPRYCLDVVQKSEALTQAVQTYKDGQQAYKAGKDGQRVLCIVNQVKRCQALAAQLERELGIEVISYHSQFRLGDRQKVHSAIVEAFAPPEPGKRIVPAIAVTTQVCEMSLDLDADVLVTELANICALVQRFGRANRHLSRGNEFKAKLLVYSPDKWPNTPPNDLKPYTKEELTDAWRFIEDLGKGNLSQRILAEKLEQHANREPMPEGWARFLTEGYYATPGDFRDIEAIRQTCILPDDLPLVQERLNCKRAFDDLTVSVPHRCVDKEYERPEWLPKWIGVTIPNKYWWPEFAGMDKDCPKRGFWENPEVQSV